jgi:hypothetical protein
MRIWSSLTYGDIFGGRSRRDGHDPRKVTDPSDATIVGAKVTLQNPHIALVPSITTDAGSFQFLLVPVGNTL